MTCCQAKAQDRQASINSLYPAAIRRLPTSIVTLIVPINTMSITVLHAFTDRRSVGQMKLPAALLMTIVGSWPRVSMHSETASRTECASRTSHFTADTYNNGLSAQRSTHVTFHRQHLQRRSVYTTFHTRHTSPQTPTTTVCLLHCRHLQRWSVYTTFHARHTSPPTPTTTVCQHNVPHTSHFTADTYNDGLSTLDLGMCTDFGPDRLRFAGLFLESVKK